MKKSISSREYKFCFYFVEYMPVAMQVIILLNIFDYYYPVSLTNWLYPFLSHSVAFDLLLLSFSRMFEFCIWHRLLIYSMLFNIILEWVIVNFSIPMEYDLVIGIILAISLIFIISSVILRFKLGCTRDERKDSDGGAS